ncbi:MAG: glycosyltransferase family 4 protein [Anaerolineae bacterium]|nr:glycosyltransferase family 4 protein [Anaerolineae bacterium]
MRLGIDTRLTYYRTGGISTYMRRLVSILEQLDHDHDYTVFHSRKSRETLTTRFRRADLWTPCHHRLERLALSLELLPQRLDLFHSPDFIPPLRGARRHIITVHDLTFLHYPQFLTAEARRYYNDQIDYAVRHADHILVDSEATQRDLVSMLSVPPEKITVHMLGVDKRFCLIDDAAERLAGLGLPPEYLLFVGTFEPRKNIVGLLRAYSKVRGRLPSVPPLLLVGRRGWLFDETLAQIESERLNTNVIWHEDISDNDLPVVYNGASVLVLPSFYEGFGFPALEAMACGCVPIVSNRSSLPEVVGSVGLQINPDDTDDLAQALEKALVDAEWRGQQRAAGLERAKAFTWENTAEVVLSVYHKVGATL